jgi:hypothetical protein
MADQVTADLYEEIRDEELSGLRGDPEAPFTARLDDAARSWTRWC